MAIPLLKTKLYIPSIRPGLVSIASHLSDNGRGRSEGLSVRLDPGGETVLWGTLDQAALHGVLIVIRDLGLKLISVNLVGDNTSAVSEETPNVR